MMILLLIIAIALILLGIFALSIAMNNTNSTSSKHKVDGIQWSAITDNELQSYLPDKKIHAIKRYRELTGVGLKEAKEAVEYIIANPNAKSKSSLSADTGGAGVRDLLIEGRVEEAIDIYAAFMGVDEFTARDTVESMQRELKAETNLSDNMDDVQTLLMEGRKIDAIKLYMQQTGASLKDAKRAVDGLDYP